jgi:hypothetical protein
VSKPSITVGLLSRERNATVGLLKKITRLTVFEHDTYS